MTFHFRKILKRTSRKSILAFGLLFAVAGCSSSFNANTVKQADYINPVAEERADPWVYKDTDDTYYFIASVPEFDRIILRSAKSINEINNAKEKVVWKKHASGIMGAHIWAPELHKIDGKWYIYFAAGEAENIWNIRMYALSNDSANPMQGEWKEEGQIKSHFESFSLDATSFEHKGKRYMIWAQYKDDSSNLWMSEMASATELTGPVIQLSTPEYDWEKVTYKVNEGAAVLIRNGKIFVTYSASATDHNYAMGLLWADVDADIMDPKNWNKSKTPVFSTNESVGRYGPGHNSFTIAEDGETDLMIYHARTYRGVKGNPLTDPNRHARVRVIQWDDNGFPVFGQALDD